jgi:hypothetical protein
MNVATSYDQNDVSSDLEGLMNVRLLHAKWGTTTVDTVLPAQLSRQPL